MIPLTEPGLARLLTWLSPGFPVGAYTYSHGLERAIEEGAPRDAAALRVWIEGVLEFGTARADADLLREAWLAVTDEDEPRFERALAWGEAARGGPELALESRQQGASFLATVSAAWPAPALTRWTERAREMTRAPAHAVAVGIAAAVHGVPLEATLLAYLHAFAANLASAAVRLIPLGQTEAQRVLAELSPKLAECARAAAARDFAEFGSAAPMIDLLSMAHETQHVRLFRS